MFAWVFMIKGLSDVGAGVSESSVSGVSWSWRLKGGMVLPLMGVSAAGVSSFFCMTRMGVLSTTTSPPRTQPGDLGSMRAMVLTGVSQLLSAAAAIGVLVTSSLTDRGSKTDVN